MVADAVLGGGDVWDALFIGPGGVVEEYAAAYHAAVFEPFWEERNQRSGSFSIRRDSKGSLFFLTPGYFTLNSIAQIRVWSADLLVGESIVVFSGWLVSPMTYGETSCKTSNIPQIWYYPFNCE